MKKLFRKVHLWLSVPFGLIITVICLSGAALIFENEVMELCRHDLYYVKRAETVPLPVEEVLAKVAGALPDSVSVTGVSISSNPERAWQVNLSKPRRASVYVDQYTGEIKGKSERAPFFATMFRLHRWLLDSMKPDGGIFWGKMIVGTATLMLVFVLISGIVVWLPRTKKALKNSLKITAKKGWHRFCYDLHIAGGLYTLVFLLAMALTGLTWSFAWYRTGFYKIFGVETQQGGGHSTTNRAGEHGAANRAGGHGTTNRAGGHHSPFANWQKVYDELKAQNPGYKQITVSKAAATVSFNRFGNQRAADRYAFNPRNGEITETTLYKDTDKSGKIRGWIFSVHVGSWGGMTTRILTFIAALLGGTLPLTGYYLWLRRLKRKAVR
ncbi:MAG: PepSY domain-containing protein [Bacteroides sp.]|nr:PepSY domain-containing protein [Bacteroides sp.]